VTHQDPPDEEDVPQESQTNTDYYALDHIHTSGTATDVYDYVLD